jgi:hypothetical protein
VGRFHGSLRQGVIKVQVEPVHQNTKTFLFWKADTAQPAPSTLSRDWGRIVGAEVKFSGENCSRWHPSIPTSERVSQYPGKVLFDVIWSIHRVSTIANPATIATTNLWKIFPRGCEGREVVEAESTEPNIPHATVSQCP